MNDKERFLLAKSYIEDSHTGYNIGTYKEKTQHMLLKFFYETDMNYHEVPVDTYIADILNDKGITEIQTAAFRALHDKLAVFLRDHNVKIVFPVHSRARTLWMDTLTGDIAYGKYSSYPKYQYKLFSELMNLSDLFPNENLTIDIVYLNVSKVRALDGYGPDKKKRATKLDIIPEEINGITTISTIDDLKRLLPFEKGERVTSADISRKLGLKRISLWRATKFLVSSDLLSQVDKKGNSIIYEMS